MRRPAEHSDGYKQDGHIAVPKRPSVCLTWRLVSREFVSYKHLTIQFNWMRCFDCVRRVPRFGPCGQATPRPWEEPGRGKSTAIQVALHTQVRVSGPNNENWRTGRSGGLGRWSHLCPHLGLWAGAGAHAGPRPRRSWGGGRNLIWGDERF